MWVQLPHSYIHYVYFVNFKSAKKSLNFVIIMLNYSGLGITRHWMIERLWLNQSFNDVLYRVNYNIQFYPNILALNEITVKWVLCRYKIYRPSYSDYFASLFSIPRCIPSGVIRKNRKSEKKNYLCWRLHEKRKSFFHFSYFFILRPKVCNEKSKIGILNNSDHWDVEYSVNFIHFLHKNIDSRSFFLSRHLFLYKIGQGTRNTQNWRKLDYK